MSAAALPRSPSTAGRGPAPVPEHSRPRSDPGPRAQQAVLSHTVPDHSSAVASPSCGAAGSGNSSGSDTPPWDGHSAHTLNERRDTVCLRHTATRPPVPTGVLAADLVRCVDRRPSGPAC